MQNLKFILLFTLNAIILIFIIFKILNPLDIIKALFIIVPVLVAVAYFTLLERKILSYSQNRKGPNIVGIYGLLQPLADGLKLFTNEATLPSYSHMNTYILAPCLALFIALIIWAVIPFNYGVAIWDSNLGILYILAVSSINVYALLMAGWTSKSKYAFVGALRAVAQMISYEVSIGLIVLSICIIANTLNLSIIVESQIYIWYLIPLWPVAIMLWVSLLAETNRTPFDLTEGESELVSGYNVEYSSMAFALFFLAEYSNIILNSIIFTILFLGGWGPFGPLYLILKSATIMIAFIWIRATLPRMRYDNLMLLLWKSYLPLSIAYLIFTTSILKC